MVKEAYVPARGDVIYLTFDPVLGNEQRGRRPALVLSSRNYNALVGLALVCPMTSKSKGYEFEVPITIGNSTSVVLSDHVRSLAWRKRNVTPAGVATRSVLAEVIRKIAILMTC